MTRQDLFNEYADVFFKLAPAMREADNPVSREDVESLRLELVRISDLVAIKVAEDAEWACEDVGRD